MSKAPKLCIFCDQTGVSKEHLFPKWLRPLFPRDAASAHTLGTVLFEGTKPLPVVMKAKQGHSGTVQFRRVCRKCNRGWMSTLEESAKPHLINLIEGRRHRIDPEIQTILARWAAKTIAVGECLQGELRLPQADREYIREHGRAPDHWRVLLFPYGGTEFRELFLWHHNGTVEARTIMTRDGVDVGEVDVQLFPIFTGYVGMGKLIIFVIASQWPKLDEYFGRLELPRFAPIWPIQFPHFEWSTEILMNDDAAANLQAVMNSITQ